MVDVWEKVALKTRKTQISDVRSKKWGSCLPSFKNRSKLLKTIWSYLRSYLWSYLGFLVPRRKCSTWTFINWAFYCLKRSFELIINIIEWRKGESNWPDGNEVINPMIFYFRLSLNKMVSSMFKASAVIELRFISKRHVWSVITYFFWAVLGIYSIRQKFSYIRLIYWKYPFIMELIIPMKNINKTPKKSKMSMIMEIVSETMKNWFSKNDFSSDRFMFLWK